jgi:hypothetical protein
MDDAARQVGTWDGNDLNLDGLLVADRRIYVDQGSYEAEVELLFAQNFDDYVTANIARHLGDRLSAIS